MKKPHGHTALEFSLMLPLFLFAAMAVTEFGWFYLHQHVLQYATREGMRVGLLGVTLEDESNNPLTREKSIVKAINDQTFSVMKIDPSKIWIFPVGSDYSDPTSWDTNPVNAGAGGAYMRVRVQYEHQFLTPFLDTFFSHSGSGIILAAEGTYRNEDF
ncbi:MAG: pilus assembly protein [Nitrospirales bacterium]|nr:pilus assembly protein [Nitrospira sp.]MDR4500985.1 pilus assembly protein [Nitrospirales bacterium]